MDGLIVAAEPSLEDFMSRRQDPQMRRPRLIECCTWKGYVVAFDFPLIPTVSLTTLMR